MEKITLDIQQIISEQIRPQLQSHGGDIEFLGLENDVVRIKLQGACSSCPGNQETVSEIIEATIQEKYPQLSVEVEFGASNELIDQALKILRHKKV